MIPSKIQKNLVDTGEVWKFEIMNSVWETVNIKKDWNKSVICPNIKKKMIKQSAEIIEALLH